MSSITQTSTTLDLVSLNLCFQPPQIIPLTSKANLDLHLLHLYQISIGKPC